VIAMTMRVKDVMTWDAVTTEPGALLAQAAALMFEGRFGSLPVMEKGKLVGIVTERDVLKALAQTLPRCGASIWTHTSGSRGGRQPTLRHLVS
jgi:CBS domain-containing protein